MTEKEQIEEKTEPLTKEDMIFVFQAAILKLKRFDLEFMQTKHQLKGDKDIYAQALIDKFKLSEDDVVSIEKNVLKLASYMYEGKE